VIDTHKIYQRLRHGGFSAEQAEALTYVLKEAVFGGDVAKKCDMAELQMITKHDLAEIEARITWRIATMLIIQTGVLFALLKLFP
jgi:hypothetical protein